MGGHPSSTVLTQAVKKGQFRDDLYYRLNVVTLHLPPLRERPHELEHLAIMHPRFFSRQAGKRIDEFSPEAKTALQRYRRPGNLRELRNAIERADILSPGPFIEATRLSEIISSSKRDHLLKVGAAVTIAELTDEHICRVLVRTTRLEEAAETGFFKSTVPKLK